MPEEMVLRELESEGIMICSKCRYIFDGPLSDGADGLPTCHLCSAVSYAKDGYQNAALMNAVMKSVVEMFKLDEAILGDDEPVILKRGRGRPRKS